MHSLWVINVNIHSGGLVPTSGPAIKHAFTMYESIRHRNTDCEYISRNTKFSIEQVQLVKNYIFRDSHVLSYGFTRFYPSYEIAESWRRLSAKKPNDIKKHNVLLLYHELTEIDIKIHHTNISHEDAHNLAEQQYNYALESQKYYSGIR